MEKISKIYVAGDTGLVGSALVRKLLELGYSNLVFTPFSKFDLTNQNVVKSFFEKERPEYVFLAAAKVGGIIANNTFRAQFIYENMMIQNNIIHHSYLNGVKKLLFLGSSCIYPKKCPQPIKEEYLLTGELEYTNEPYAIAKIAGIKMCEAYNNQYGTNFISVMPTNLYGPNDNYNLKASHVLPALIRKMHIGKCLENSDWDSLRDDLKRYPVENLNPASSEKEILQVLMNYGIEKSSENNSITISLWGTGSPYREFLYVDDLAEACIFVMRKIDASKLDLSSKINPELKNTHINIGTGKDLTIKDLAEMIKDIVGFQGNLAWDYSKPDGTFRKLLDVSKINSLGWHEKVTLDNGIAKVYSRYGI